MESNKQVQKAGENSQQYQVGTLIVNQGISEERARSIFSEMIPSALQAYTSDAYALADQRIGKLEDNILPKLDKIDGLLPAFADPAFQILLRKAQQAAASTEREDDYSLLSELLVCHVQKGEDRKNRAGISQAIEIVDQIDNDALCALTVAHAVTHFFPISGDCREGLQTMDSLFRQLIYQELPHGAAWLDHLDILGAVRISILGNMKKFSEYYASVLDGYICVGIKKDSDNHKKAVELLSAAQIGSNFLVPNECLDGYVRLKISKETSIDKLTFPNGQIRIPLHELTFPNGQIRIPLHEEQKSAIRQVWGLYSKDSKLHNEAKTNFMKLWDGYDSLHKLREWWESIPSAFQITRVGVILAHTNAKRCSPDLPDLI